MRNDRIGRARLQINIRQDSTYVHVNSFRIGYLANNRTAILSEVEDDPTNYLQYATVTDPQTFAEAAADMVRGEKWRQLREASYECYKQIRFKNVMEELLDSTFSKFS